MAVTRTKQSHALPDAGIESYPLSLFARNKQWAYKGMPVLILPFYACEECDEWVPPNAVCGCDLWQ